MPRSGFTLIELSIVLVIIGLIVGGVLVGQDLIAAARIRAGMKQIESYNSAAYTFRGKYNHLPGDLRAPEAASLGFQTRSGAAGYGDGNGAIDSCGLSTYDVSCERVLFWSDLSSAALLEGQFISDGASPVNASTPAQIAALLPRWRMGKESYVTVHMGGSGGIFARGNLFQVGSYDTITNNTAATRQVLTPAEALAIDAKYDDGMPTTGRIKAAGLPPWLMPTSVLGQNACCATAQPGTCAILSGGVGIYYMASGAVNMIACQLDIMAGF